MNSLIEKKEKINWLLILQAWAMLWVVIGHSPLSMDNIPSYAKILFNFAYSFHMPLFMLVSGWLFYLTRLRLSGVTPTSSHWTYKKIVKDKVVRLLLPGVVFTFLSFTFKVAIPGEVSRQTGFSPKEIAMAFLYPYDNPFREYWFIATLLWFFLMTPAWKTALKIDRMEWGMLAVLVLLHFRHPSIELLCIGRVFRFAIWFYLGLIICKENWVDRYLKRWPWVTIIVGVIIYAVSRFIVRGSLHSFGGVVGGIIMSFGLVLIADKYIPRLFYGFRNYTYQIFLMGIFAQMAVKIVYRHVSMPYVAMYILCIVAGLYVPVYASKVIERINWKPLSLCMGLK